MRTNTRNYAIDFIRVIATTVIVFLHYQEGAVIMCEKYHTFFAYFTELFFVISGFMVSKYIDKIYSGDMEFFPFIIKKYIRLIPLQMISVFAEIMIYYVVRVKIS